MVVIPGSGNPEHIKESLDLFGFELTDDLPFIRKDKAIADCSIWQA
jgi:diketogulonate reductase-like aldo/keto reductase